MGKQRAPRPSWIKDKEDRNEGQLLFLVARDFDQIGEDLGMPPDQATVQIARLVNGGLLLGERMSVLGQRSPVGFKKVGWPLGTSFSRRGIAWA